MYGDITTTLCPSSDCASLVYFIFSITDEVRLIVEVEKYSEWYVLVYTRHCIYKDNLKKDSIWRAIGGSDEFVWNIANDKTYT